MEPSQFPFFANIDTFLTECTTFESQNGNHTSYKFIKENLSEFDSLKVKKIVLVHIGGEVFDQIDSNVPSKIVIAEDGLILSV